MREIKLIEKIEKNIKDLMKMYGVDAAGLDYDGAIIYGNANDGTQFDWAVNGCLCEIGSVFAGAWCVKCLIHKDGDAVYYIYPNGEMKPAAIFSDKTLPKDGPRLLYKFFLKYADDLGHYDATLDTIKTEALTIYKE